MPSSPLRVGVVISSVRSGRFADTVADWVVSHARQRGDMLVDVIDLSEPSLLAELKLSLGPGQDPQRVPRLSELIERQEAYIVVTPEYNHGYPASLKLAIDCVYSEWRAKPVSFVSYGGMAGGQRAVEQLRQVFAEMHVVTLRDTLSFHNAWEQFSDDGCPRDADTVSKAATVMLDQLTWWGTTLREGRAARPYSV